MINLLVLYVQYDKEKYPNSFDFVEKYTKKLNTNVTYLILDNAHCSLNAQELDENKYLIGGNNLNWEFSAWQKGLQWANDNSIEYNMVLFVNDALKAYDPNILETSINTVILEKALRECSAIGKVDGLKLENNKFKLKGYSFNSWIRTNTFFIPKIIVDELDQLAIINECNINEFLALEPNEGYFLHKADMNDALKHHIIEWLSVKWHSAFKLEDNWELFRNKTRAIFNEQLLSARIKDKHFNIINASDIKY